MFKILIVAHVVITLFTNQTCLDNDVLSENNKCHYEHIEIITNSDLEDNKDIEIDTRELIDPDVWFN